MTSTLRGGGVERKAKIEDVCGCLKGGGGCVKTDMWIPLFRKNNTYMNIS